MTQAISSAEPQQLFHYSEMLFSMDQELLTQANNLEQALRHFEDTCTEPDFRLQVNYLAGELRAYISSVVEIDQWVFGVGKDFQQADQAAGFVSAGYELLPQKVTLTEEEISKAARKLINDNTKWQFSWALRDLKETDLAKALRDLLIGENQYSPADRAAIALDVFNGLHGWRRDDVAYELAKVLSDEEIAHLGADPNFRQVLLKMIEKLQNYWTGDEQAATMERIARNMSPRLAEMATEPWLGNPDIQKTLLDWQTIHHRNISFQSLEDEAVKDHDLAYDHYSVTVRMPPGLTPENFLAEIAKDPDKAIDFSVGEGIKGEIADALVGDNSLPYIAPGFPGDFKRNQLSPNASPNAPTQVGDIFDINFLGWDNGSVMVVDMRTDRFVVQTITDGGGDGKHPIHGVRAFGFDRLADGRVRFYTEGVTRNDTLLAQVAPGVPRNYWERAMTGISLKMSQLGGDGSLVSHWSTHREQGVFAMPEDLN